MPGGAGQVNDNLPATPTGGPTMTTSSPGARPHTVNAALTPNRRNRIRVENDAYGAFARRVVAGHGRRIAAGDVECLRDLLALAEEIDCATDTAVAGLRQHGYSWAEIASRLGITRQAAQQRWGGASAA
jgi:hypothetical protein